MEARLELVSSVLRDTVAYHLARISAGAADPAAETAWLQEFWWNVLTRLKRGELVMRGRKIGTGETITLAADMLDDAEPDFQTNRITCCGVTLGGVRIFEQAPLSVGASPVATLRLTRPQAAPSGRLDYRASDLALISKMANLINAGDASGPEAAAGMVAKMAAGAGKPASKVTRLLKRWREQNS